MPLHYKKDGSLDMRYSSSKAAVSSGYSGSGGGGYSGFGGGNSGSGYMFSSPSYASSSYSSQPSSSGGLHYKKDGTLDMRYSSSKAAVSSGHSGSGGGYSSSGYSSQPSSSGGLHYKKDGTLDMRYSSSKAAVSSGHSGSGGGSSGSGYSSRPSSSSSDLHFKKDGTLDMRYSSSKAAAMDIDAQFRNLGLNYKKDGTLDMRYSSSKQAAHGIAGRQNTVPSTRISTGIPSRVPLTKGGLPDMRTTAAKAWVQQQAEHSGTGSVPNWIPQLKDGSPDYSKAVTAECFNCRRNQCETGNDCYDPCRRENYYREKLQSEDLFRQYVDQVRREHIQILQVSARLLEITEEIRRGLTATGTDGQGGSQNGYQLSSDIPQIEAEDLKLSSKELGRGAFGVVLQGTYKGKPVAVKRLHLQNLSRKEKASFSKEIQILAKLGAHPNLVTFYGYMLSPPTMVMEFVDLGSLNFLLHHSEDVDVEAKITDGRIKKRIVVGVINGMRQIHAVNIVHGDLKPHNILLSKDFEAKVTDFGLATLRGKTSTTVESSVTADGEGIVGGTAGYMAPELLSSSSPPELASDVYSFGVVLNEIVQEEDPYNDQYQNFQGRGPFAAANYAKMGNRPKIGSKTPLKLQALIKKCWKENQKLRPSFQDIAHEIEGIEIPNSC